MKTLILSAFVLLAAAPSFAADSRPSGRPGLHERSAAGPDGRKPDTVLKDLRYARENMARLLDYLEPFDGTAGAEGEDEAWAQAQLLRESAACDSLIVEADAILAAGIARGGRNVVPLYFPSQIMSARKKPSLADMQRSVARAQINVAGHLGSLIDFKTLEPARPEDEEKVAGWLATARSELGSRQDSLNRRREREASIGVKRAAERAGVGKKEDEADSLRSSSTLNDD